MSAQFNDPKLPPRFWAKVRAEPNGCWLWTGAHSAKGYGFIHYNGKMRRVHRVAYLVLTGPITEATLDHLCNNEGCVNPTHLKPASHKENILRGGSRPHYTPPKHIVRVGTPTLVPICTSASGGPVTATHAVASFTRRPLSQTPPTRRGGRDE